MKEPDFSQGLIPAIVQDAETHAVLMLGYMNSDAYQKTLETGLVTFYSRSRQALWTKGETSGYYLRLVELRIDCDGDALLIRALPQGPTCHRGTYSCFSEAGELPGSFWPISGVSCRSELRALRKAPIPPNSYKLAPPVSHKKSERKP